MNLKYQPKELHFTVPYTWVVRKQKLGRTHKQIYEIGLECLEEAIKKDKKKKNS